MAGHLQPKVRPQQCCHGGLSSCGPDNFPTTVSGWEIRPLNLDTTVVDDACAPYPAGTPQLDGVIPLVRRGTCTL